MTPKELKLKLDNNQAIYIVDIREPYECENGSISDVNIPMNQVINRISEIPKNKAVLLYCNTGKRSKSLKYMIEKLYQYKQLNHLEGGYQAWEELLNQ